MSWGTHERISRRPYVRAVEISWERTSVSLAVRTTCAPSKSLGNARAYLSPSVRRARRRNLLGNARAYLSPSVRARRRNLFRTRVHRGRQDERGNEIQYEHEVYSYRRGSVGVGRGRSVWKSARLFFDFSKNFLQRFFGSGRPLTGPKTQRRFILEFFFLIFPKTFCNAISEVAGH